MAASAANPKVPLERHASDLTREMNCSDLTKCGICKETVNDPKALQCLHTFCLVCLEEWISGNKSSDVKSVVCPACKKSTSLSADDGIEGLPGNFFVSSLMERSKILTPEMITACICCEEMKTELLATCATCEGFLCKKGIESHKTMKFLKTHEVVRLEDLEADTKRDFGSIFAKQPACRNHKGQPLWLYCETCSELICRDCTSANHKNPDHVYVVLESITTDQRSDIKHLVEKSSQIKSKIHDILQNTKSAGESLSSNAKQAAAAIEKAGQTAQESVIEQIHKHVKAEQDKLDEWVSDSEKKLANTEEKLLNHQSQLQRCEEMANEVLKTGSDYDVASIYKQLVNSLEEANFAEYPVLEPGLDKIMFGQKQASLNIKAIGGLTFGVKKVSTRNWMLETEFEQNGRIEDPRGVAVTPSGDIAVANYDAGDVNPNPVQIYTKTGLFKQSLDEKSTDAWNVAALNDRLFVTIHDKKTVATFNSQGKYLSEFPAVSPDEIKSTDEGDIALAGLAVYQNKLLLVGEEKHKYISTHTSDGSHVRSIKSPISPLNLCTTSEGNIIVSASAKKENVYVMDMFGNQLMEIKPPQSVRYWSPKGICVSQNDEICIADVTNSSVYCFAETGQYLGCIGKDLNKPIGIALMENDTRLIVVENNGDTIKIFKAT